MNLIFAVNFLCNFCSLIINIFVFFIMVLMFLAFLVIFGLYLYSAVKGVNFIMLFSVLLYMNYVVNSNVI